MRKGIYILLSSFFFLSLHSAAYSQCDLNKKIGTSRVIEIDTKGGPLFGRYSYPKTIPLQPGEVVLTFDDGPHPIHTETVLKVLKEHCVKATFFAVGAMAEENPATLRKVAADGHTIGAHSQTHPKMTFIPLMNAKVEIEKSFDAIIKAVGGPVAPFFRYPGLRYSKQMDAYMKTRDIGVFSVDVVSGDTRNKNTPAILNQTLGLLKRRKNRGIVLLHDLQETTAAALPELLAEMKKRGMKIVHIVPKKTMSKTRYKEVRQQFIASSSKKKTTIPPWETKKVTVKKNIEEQPEILVYENKKVWQEVSEALASFFEG